jgi:hypothetical protein
LLLDINSKLLTESFSCNLKDTSNQKLSPMSEIEVKKLIEETLSKKDEEYKIYDRIIKILL